MAYILSFLIILMSGCGIKVSTDPVKVEKVQVEHTVKLNIQNVGLFYQGICELELGSGASDAALATCVDKKVKDFLDAYNFGSI